MNFAKLNSKNVAKLRALEAELGSWIVAVEPPVQPAKLSKCHLKRLQAVEEELGVVLLAYKPEL